MRTCICGFGIGNPMVTKHTDECNGYQLLKAFYKDVRDVHSRKDLDEVDRDSAVWELLQEMDTFKELEGI